ncbi:hypothetical protein [Pseudomonas syringae]|uniref:hypothetical protein n=1 Tax=Pseudomonas syringae TaxID=317 RepID=UPI00128F71F3|nr:hypothetical protein [Pseudomonas syringae]
MAAIIMMISGKPACFGDAMDKHELAVDLLKGLLTGEIKTMDLKNLMIHGQIVQDHLDDFEVFFKSPDTEWVIINYQNTKTLEDDRRLTIQFMMFALGRESLLLRQTKPSAH